jgi:hypothetical protein
MDDQPGKQLFHDDDCGVLLDSDGRCPKCGFCHDMQSTGFRQPTATELAQRRGAS